MAFIRVDDDDGFPVLGIGRGSATVAFVKGINGGVLVEAERQLVVGVNVHAESAFTG
jgi:hypothetical protein